MTLLNLGRGVISKGSGFVALDALHRYKNRRKLMLQPTRELHAGMNEFQRQHGYQVVPYERFADTFFKQPWTDDMRQMLDDLEPYRAYMRGDAKHP